MARTAKKTKETTVTFTIDSSVHAKLTKQLSARGTDLETFLRLQLRVHARNKVVLNLDDEMPFGKYSGEVIEDIVRTDPTYMNWICGQDGKTKFSEEVLELLEEVIEE